MGRAKKPITTKVFRTWQDPVTGQLHTLELDAVQLALERVLQSLDGQLLKLTPESGYRLVERLQEELVLKLPHTGGTGA